LSSDPEQKTETSRPRRKARRLASIVAGGGMVAAVLGAGANPAVAGETTTTGEGQPGTGTTTTEGTTTTPTPPVTTPSETPVVTEPAPPKVIVKKPQRPAPKVKTGPSSTPTAPKHRRRRSKGRPESANVAGAPGAVAQLSALQALLSSAQTSSEALQFYRIPLFLLPIYKAAAVQYGVPWQVLAAINEIETDYGRNLSVSSAGAVGWMQFMPSTWKTWGVDANGDGVADPYNPVDAIFSAARYLHAAATGKWPWTRPVSALISWLGMPPISFARRRTDWTYQVAWL